MNLPHISDWQNEAGVPDADCSPSHPVKTSVAQYRYPSVSRRGDVRVWAGRYTRVAGRYRAQEWGTYACRYGLPVRGEGLAESKRFGKDA